MRLIVGPSVLRWPQTQSNHGARLELNALLSRPRALVRTRRISEQMQATHLVITVSVTVIAGGDFRTSAVLFENRRVPKKLWGLNETRFVVFPTKLKNCTFLQASRDSSVTMEALPSTSLPLGFCFSPSLRYPPVALSVLTFMTNVSYAPFRRRPSGRNKKTATFQEKRIWVSCYYDAVKSGGSQSACLA